MSAAAGRKRRVYIGLWLSTSEYREIADRMEEVDTTGDRWRGALIRHLVRYAVKHMPEGWDES